jgi:Holliday junction resolvasome RuvABC endonuclease subunit
MIVDVLSIDPGLRKCGCATWTAGGELIAAWTARCSGRTRGPEAWRAIARAVVAPPPRVVAIETMQVDGRTRGKEKGILELSGVVGVLTARFWDSEVAAYTPRQWKGNVPKEVMRARLRSRLTPAEMSRIDSRATHDAWDAIGIGAYYFRQQGESRWQRTIGRGEVTRQSQ